MSTEKMALDYRDLSTLDLAWRPGYAANSDIAPGETGPDAPVTSIGGGAALALLGRAQGSGLCIDFAEFVDTAR